jgi:hypothetical protein
LSHRGGFGNVPGNYDPDLRTGSGRKTRSIFRLASPTYLRYGKG